MPSWLLADLIGRDTGAAVPARCRAFGTGWWHGVRRGGGSLYRASALPLATAGGRACPFPFRRVRAEGGAVGSVIKKRRKRMAKKKHRKLLKKTRIQRRNKK
jgi:hypothetical protein